MQAREAADAKTQEWQRQIRKGNYFKQSTPYRFDIYSKVLEVYAEEHLKHYRFCFSEACPGGEKGNVHISVIEGLISKESFEALYAKMNNGKKPP